jgi:hypothetical protein
MIRRAVRSERGSLPVVMLAILIMGSLITVVVGTTVMGQGQTRFDQGFEQSLSIAEIGLERMEYQVKLRPATTLIPMPETAAGGGRYSGSAQRSGHQWTLTSTGSVDRPCPVTAAPSTTPCRTARTLTLTITVESLFGLAAYGRTQVDLRGSNSADSYRSGTLSASPAAFSRLASGSNICSGTAPANPFSASDSGSTRMCTPTGKGAVATNGELFLRGGVIDDVDRAEIHYAREVVPDPLPGATGVCLGVTATCSSLKLKYFQEPIAVEPDPVLAPAGVKLGVFPPPSSTCPLGVPLGTTACLPAGPQIYTNMTLDSKTFIQGTPDNPTIVYLTGTLTIPNGEVVNFEKNGAGNWVPKPAPGLLIYSAGIGPALSFGNHASFSGAVYAPRATFSGGAAGNIYGSMVTGSISTQGAWRFHYDEALGDVDTEARFLVSGWTEQ